jgi:hypothetical protein
LAAVVAAGCSGAGGSGADDEPEVEPVSLVGETEQGLRLRIDPVGDREVSLRIPATCQRQGSLGQDVAELLRGQSFETEVGGDGTLRVDEEYVEDGTDGDEEHVEVRIDGEFTDDGTAAGTIAVTSRWWNGQSEDFSADCDTGTVAWTADRPPVEGDNLVMPVAGPMRLAPAGADVVARSEAGELLRVEATTGEARRLDGSGPAGEAPPGPAPGGPTVADPNAPTTAVASPPTTVVASPPTEVPQVWPTPLEVVADGVWMVDPSTGMVSRFGLADGARTATIDAPLDAIAAGPDALWTVSTNVWRSGYALDKRDPVTGAVLASTPVERGAIVVGPTDVWYADSTWAGGRLAPVDPASLALGERVAADVPLYGDELVHSGDRVWWLDTEGLMSVELATGRVGLSDLPSKPDAVAGDATGVWTVHSLEAVARRIEGDSVVRTVDIPDGWWSATVAADGAVWLHGSGAIGDEPSIVRLDPAVTG